MRASHWLITGLFGALFLSGHFGLGPTWLHIWLGYGLITVLLFRLGWGLIGSDSARWGSLFPAPSRIMAYLPLLFSRQPSRWPGHNPVGALSALVLIGLLLIQCLSGLFVETWSEYRGPLAERMPRSFMMAMTDLHSVLRWPLLALVIVHLTAVFAYLGLKRENRIRPIFGNGELILDREPTLEIRGGRRAWTTWLLAAALTALVVWLGPVY